MASVVDKKPHLSELTFTLPSAEGEVLEGMPSVASGTFSPVAVDLDLEKQALKKFDMFLLPQLALLTILAYLDRTNIGNAKVFGLAEGLKLKGNEFNILVTFFYITYIVCDVLWVISIQKVWCQPRPRCRHGGLERGNLWHWIHKQLYELIALK
uniref:Major facilitator superfamily (MFS) profile domain-containing protein n=1 Tax=Bionectria ochroleuca TaxID=29856 RepID=A0A8H7K5U8_BIOOC